MVLPAVALPSYIATQVDVLQSDRVAQRAVKLLHLDDNAELRQKWLEDTGGQGSFDAWAAGTFQKQVDVKPSRESNVITVSYAARDPHSAAAVVNAIVQAYLDTTVDLQADPARQYNAYFDERAKKLRQDVEAAQKKLSAFQTEHGIINNDERLDVETARLNDLSTQLVMLQTASAESSSRNVAAGRSGDQLAEVLNNPVVSTLKTELAAEEARLQELSSRLGSAHPQVIESKAKVAELRSRLEAESRKVMGSVGVTNQINQSREAQIRADLEAQRAKVLKLKAERDQAMVLQRDVENAQRAYDAVLQRRDQTSLESHSTQSDASVLSRAVEPTEPSAPRPVLNTILSVFVGLLLAMGAALLMEMLDRRVRTNADAYESLGVPLLGVLPGTASARRGRSGTPLLQNRILGQLPRPAEGA
jgi:chain length determinant protein EpsF